MSLPSIYFRLDRFRGLLNLGFAIFAQPSPYGCQPKDRGKTPKMDGENHGKPYEQMDDLGGKHPYFWKHPYPQGMLFFWRKWTPEKKITQMLGHYLHKTHGLLLGSVHH